ncbi:MAG: hypothetical protein IIB17_08405 [Chloroflexi bacterium]|nr:hypothetical protein [Chloroflexota bacterium]
MVNIELLINVLARAALGLFSAAALSFGFWWLTWVSFNTSNLGLASFFMVQASIIGGSAAVPTVLAWWNTQSSRKVHWLSVCLTLGAAVVGAWLVNEIRGIETHKALVGGVLRVSVFSLSHMQTSMIAGAVFGGNAMAAAFYLYRALRHREF